MAEKASQIAKHGPDVAVLIGAGAGILYNLGFEHTV
jgi:hypothetical protein